MRRNAAWMFEDWPEGTYYRAGQLLATAWLRLWTPILWMPARRLLRAIASHRT